MRTRFKWSVQLQSSRGEVADETVETFWDPGHEGTTEQVGVAGMVQAWLKAGKPTEKASDAFYPLSVTLV
jgi:hypothetical protein